MALDVAKIKAVIFDIDGTLSDSDDQIVDQVERFLKPFLFFIGGLRRKAAARWLVMEAETPGNFLYHLADCFDIDRLFARFSAKVGRNQTANRREYRIIFGVPEMLTALALKYPLAVVSARNEKSSMAFIHQFNLAPFFHVIVTSQTTRRTKPFPDPLLCAAEKLGLPPANCLMVGDTTVDMRAAKQAGMQAAGVLCGFGREWELRRAGADEIFSLTTDIGRIL
jgi:phosphoglycolate phosphatase-like HAD superfamily hydrolase